MSNCHPCGTTVFPVNTPEKPDTCKPDLEFASMKFPVYCPTGEYSKKDPCMLLGVEGSDAQTIVWSLTDEPNKDSPIDGVRKTPPTWVIKTACELFKGE